MNRQSILYTIIFTFAVSFLFVLFLAFANEGTSEQVALNQQVNRQRAILTAMGVEFDGPQDILDKFTNVSEVNRNGMILYRTELDGTTVFAKEFSGSGLWGTISGVIAVDENLEQTVGIEIISHNETPGLGGRIDEPWFKQQLRGEQIVDGSIRVGSAGDGDYNASNGEIDAITGASRTSDSMQVILDTEISALAGALGGNS